MLTGELLDDGGRGLARALAGVGVAVVLLLFLAVFVPLAVVVSIVDVAVPRAAQPPVTTSPPHTPGQWPVVNLPPRAAGSQLVDVARRYLGVAYLFGGTDPAIGLDCSGLVQLVFRQLGIVLPRTAQLQYDVTARVARDQLQPGDLVFFAQTYTDPHDWITHVGIYIGDGLQIDAPTVGQVVSIQPVFGGFWGAHFVGGGRVVNA